MPAVADLENSIVKEFENEPRVVTAIMNQAEGVNTVRRVWTNYYLRGPDSKKSLAFDESNSLAEAHFSGNFMNGELPDSQWELVRFKDGREAGNDAPFPAAPVKTRSAKQYVPCEHNPLPWRISLSVSRG